MGAQPGYPGGDPGPAQRRGVRIGAGCRLCFCSACLLLFTAG